MPGTGILDHRSALDLTRDEVIFFDGQSVRAARIADGATRDLFRMPDDRMAIGQNCVTPDGRWFVYIHADRGQYQGMFADDPDYPTYWSRREQCRDTRLAAFDLATGEHRTLLVISSPIHHVLAYDERHLLFCHPTAEDGMLLTDVDGGWYTHLRTQDVHGGKICHFLGTSRGATYEVLEGSDGLWAGICDPFGRATYEVRLPADFGYVHTGRDPDGLLWFYENEGRTVHDLWLLAAHDPNGTDAWLPLTGDWPAFGDIDAQKAHFHPQVVLDRQWMLLTGGDPTSGTNHVFLLDISDLDRTTGIPDVTGVALRSIARLSRCRRRSPPRTSDTAPRIVARPRVPRVRRPARGVPVQRRLPRTPRARPRTGRPCPPPARTTCPPGRSAHGRRR